MKSAMMSLSPLSLLVLFLCQAYLVAADEEPSNYGMIVEAHGIMGSLAVVIFLPLGAILLRVLSRRAAVLSHLSTQIVGILFLTATAGMGIWQARITDQLETYHAIIGLIVFGLAWLQLFGGIVHHLSFKRTGQRSWASHAHIRVGAMVITLGIINGGMGLMLSGDSTNGEQIAYGVIGAVIWLLWLFVVVWAEGRRENSLAGRESTEMINKNGKD